MKSKKPAKQQPDKTKPITAGKEKPSFVKNLLLFLCSFLLIWSLKNFNAGYQWLFDTVIDQNIEAQQKLKTLSFEERLSGRIGYNSSYLDFIKKNTPEDAIIIMPVDTEYFPKGEHSDFDKNINVMGWASYFVYPRRLVSPDPLHRTPLYAQATHMAIVNRCGYDRLPYTPQTRSKYAVLPLHPNPETK